MTTPRTVTITIKNGEEHQYTNAEEAIQAYCLFSAHGDIPVLTLDETPTMTALD